MTKQSRVSSDRRLLLLTAAPEPRRPEATNCIEESLRRATWCATCLWIWQCLALQICGEAGTETVQAMNFTTFYEARLASISLLTLTGFSKFI